MKNKKIDLKNVQYTFCLEVQTSEKIVDHLLDVARDLKPGNHLAACCSYERCGSYNQSEKRIPILREDYPGGKPFVVRA